MRDGVLAIVACCWSVLGTLIIIDTFLIIAKHNKKGVCSACKTPFSSKAQSRCLVCGTERREK